jgi:hypothetical protein
LSYFANLAQTKSTVKPDGVRILWIWPVFCIPLGLTGCYFGPIKILEADVPPEIVSSNKAPWDGPLQLEGGTNIYAYVQDEDQGTLRFEWLLSDEGWVDSAQTLSPGATQIYLDADPKLDGQRLTLSVYDSAQHFDSVYWDLEVLR